MASKWIIALSLYKDKSHGLDVPLFIVDARVLSLVPISVSIMVILQYHNHSRVTYDTVIFIVAKDANSCLGKVLVVTLDIEAFLVTVHLQRC